MALATTCPQCKTSFKVVPDQLKLRRGLVRCGVCQHVFSGVEHLRYVDKDEKTEKATPVVSGSDHATTAQAAGTDATASAHGAGRFSPSSPMTGSPPDADAPVPPSAATTDGREDVPVESPDGDEEQARAAEGLRKMAEAARMFRELDEESGAPGEEAGTSDGGIVAGAEDAHAAADDGGHGEHDASTSASSTDEELHTRFFMSDHESDNHGDTDTTRLPASLRRNGGAVPQADPLEPDSAAAGALIDEANEIWRQQRPRQAEAVADEAIRNADGRRKRRSSRSKSADADKRRRSGRAGVSQTADTATRNRLTRWLTPARTKRLIIALTILAIIQLLSVFRSEIAYQLPFLRPLASLASTVTGQRIEAPMNLKSLSIESFELRSTHKAGQTRMTAILRNRSELPARWPAMELSLKGPSQAVLVRKVLLPAQYLPASLSIQDGIPAHVEQPLDLILDTGELNLAGYEVELFYP
ncbi:MAG: DUF3426 domain-containing protein [Lautropia sp.]|nr:DUF3426 domain-containing protein [Lautropia sp.]